MISAEQERAMEKRLVRLAWSTAILDDQGARLVESHQNRRRIRPKEVDRILRTVNDNRARLETTILSATGSRNPIQSDRTDPPDFRQFNSSIRTCIHEIRKQLQSVEERLENESLREAVAKATERRRKLKRRVSKLANFVNGRAWETAGAWATVLVCNRVLAGADVAPTVYFKFGSLAIGVFEGAGLLISLKMFYWYVLEDEVHSILSGFRKATDLMREKMELRKANRSHQTPSTSVGIAAAELRERRHWSERGRKGPIRLVCKRRRPLLEAAREVVKPMGLQQNGRRPGRLR
jgi:hypothetical protein